MFAFYSPRNTNADWRLTSMSDDKSKTRPQDAPQIDVHEPYELEYWTKRFGVTADRLKKAVENAGTSVQAVEAELKTRK